MTLGSSQCMACFLSRIDSVFSVLPLHVIFLILSSSYPIEIKTIFIIAQFWRYTLYFIKFEHHIIELQEALFALRVCSSVDEYLPIVHRSSEELMQ